MRRDSEHACVAASAISSQGAPASQRRPRPRPRSAPSYAESIPAPVTQTPTALVLGGGGILGEAWMSAVLAGLDEGDGFDSRACGRYLGTSAGSIVAASLVAGIEPASRLGELPEQPPFSAQEVPQSSLWSLPLGAAAGLGGAAAGPLASIALNAAAPGGALLRRAALRRLPEGRRSLSQLTRAVERSGASWDGRLWVAAVDLHRGTRVLFGAPGAPELSVAMAVEASCAIPGVFRPVRSAGRAYVDGGVWSPTNMDVVEASQGISVLCLNPTGSLRPALGSLTGALGSVSRGVAGAEALALRHRGADVQTINPDATSSAALGANLMDPARRGAVIAAGLAQGRKLASLPRSEAA
ncbi:MAG: patatin-like phospholipase family protein [Solirubrobacteraceae bacterium]